MADKKSNVKKRNWAFVLYPESAPPDWMAQLQQTGLQCAVSPLHDRDKDPTGEPKKPHYHVIVVYGGPTSYNVVKSITDSLNAPIPQALEQIQGYYRYLTHKDNADKAQYDEADITTVNGFSIRDYVEMSKSEVTKLKIFITDFVEEYDIREYQELLVDLKRDGLMDAWDVASNHTLFVNAYITSRRHRLEKAEK